MTFVKIKDTLYPAEIRGKVRDMEWDDRESKAITLEMTYEEAMEIFSNDTPWSIIWKSGDEKEEEYDNSDFCVAGPVTDNRNGTVTVKMGKITDAEALAELMEVLA